MKKPVKVKVKESAEAKRIVPGAYVEIAGQMYRVKTSVPRADVRTIGLESR